MMNIALWILTFVVLLLCAVSWKTYQIVRGPHLQPGDIVLFVRHGANDPHNNMITQVLYVRGDSVIYRGRGDTLEGSTVCGGRRRDFIRLPVDPNRPIQVPGEPKVRSFLMDDGDTDTNGATWKEIPLTWFPYMISKQLWQKKKSA